MPTNSLDYHTSPSLNSKKNDGFIYNLVFGPGGAATMAGICEIIIFHPFDTAAKRLMSHQHHIFNPTSFSDSWRKLQQVLFKGIEQETAAGAKITVLHRVKHMYPGSAYAVTYKVLQRFVKFAGQPYMRDFLHQKFGHFLIVDQKQETRGLRNIKNAVRKKNHGAIVLEAGAGCLVGICEVALLPVDRMKVLSQTNKEAVKNRSFLCVLRQEGILSLYAGSGATALRNAIGAFLLFGVTAFVKEYAFHLDNYRDATFLQNIVSSTVGGCVGVLCVSPIDVVKTRIQNKRFEEGRVSGLSIMKETVRREGLTAFYKGICPKLLTTAPRLVFSYTMTQFFTKYLRGTQLGPSSSSSAQK